MTSVLISILIIVLVGAAIYAIIQYAPFIQPQFKTWALYAVGAIVLVLIILQLVPLLQGIAGGTVVTTTTP